MSLQCFTYVRAYALLCLFRSFDEICDQACKNRAYLHIKFWPVSWTSTLYNFSSTFHNFFTAKAMLLQLLKCVGKSIRNQIKFTENAYLIQWPRRYHFLNVCILCRYARFLRAQSHFQLIPIMTTIMVHDIRDITYKFRKVHQVNYGSYMCVINPQLIAL